MNFGFMECCPNRETMGKSTNEMNWDHSKGMIGLPGKGEGSLEELALDGQMGGTVQMDRTEGDSRQSE